MLKAIQVVPYDHNWPHIFEQEAALLRQSLGHNCLEIHHIGSTSVPGLAAKPIIDIVAVVQDPLLARHHLEEMGIRYRGEYNIPLHYGFDKRGDMDVHLHVYEESHAEIPLNLCFRDYLRHHPHKRDEYALLKEELIKDESSFIKEKNSPFTNYTLRKGDFIRGILREAGFHRIRMLKCNDHTEWQAAYHFRNTHFFGGIEDPYTWTFHHEEHAHLVLYEGTDIVGYAHIQFWPDQRAAVRMLACDDEKKANQNADSQFLALIEKWVKRLGIQSTHVESRQSSLGLYLKNGYTHMPFDDPENHESDPHTVPVGKVL